MAPTAVLILFTTTHTTIMITNNNTLPHNNISHIIGGSSVPVGSNFGVYQHNIVIWASSRFAFSFRSHQRRLLPHGVYRKALLLSDAILSRLPTVVSVCLILPWDSAEREADTLAPAISRFSTIYIFILRRIFILILIPISVAFHIYFITSILSIIVAFFHQLLSFDFLVHSFEYQLL